MGLIIFCLVVIVLMVIVSFKAAGEIVDFADDVRDGARRQKKIERLLEDKDFGVYNDNRQVHIHNEGKEIKSDK